MTFCVATDYHGNGFTVQSKLSLAGRESVEWVNGTRGVYVGKSFQHPFAFEQQRFSSPGSCCKFLLSSVLLPFFLNFFSFYFLLPLFIYFCFGFCIFISLYLTPLPFSCVITSRPLQSLTLVPHPCLLQLLLAWKKLKRTAVGELSSYSLPEGSVRGEVGRDANKENFFLLSCVFFLEHSG